jgi:hypothetical protein
MAHGRCRATAPTTAACDGSHVCATAAGQSGGMHETMGSELGAVPGGHGTMAEQFAGVGDGGDGGAGGDGGDGGDGWGGGDGESEAVAAAWLRLAKREREKGGARGAGTMTVGEADGRRSGLQSEPQHNTAVGDKIHRG